MAHIGLKVRLKDARETAELKQHFESKGASLFFTGAERDKIYYGPNDSFVKHRRMNGVGNASWASNPESDEITGINGDDPLVPVDQTAAIYYRDLPIGLPSPHYMITVTTPVLNGVGKNIYTDKALYSDVQKERDIYWLTQRSETQGSRQSNLRVHFDKVDLGRSAYFMEIEAKFSNYYSHNDIVQAQADLEMLKAELHIKDEDVVRQSYGAMRRRSVMGNVTVQNDWIDAVPFELLQEFSASKQKAFAAEQNLMVENGLNDGAYVILDGKVRVFHDDKTHDFHQGYILGELATYNKSDRRCATVTAVEATNALHLSKELVADLCSCPEVLGGWLKRYAPMPGKAA